MSDESSPGATQERLLKSGRAGRDDPAVIEILHAEPEAHGELDLEEELLAESGVRLVLPDGDTSEALIEAAATRWR